MPLTKVKARKRKYWFGSLSARLQTTIRVRLPKRVVPSIQRRPIEAVARLGITEIDDPRLAGVRGHEVSHKRVGRPAQGFRRRKLAAIPPAS
jgi:hypothetical protein